MRKHILMSLKHKAAGKLPWYIKLTDEQLSGFSVAQIENLCGILSTAEKYRESKQVWFDLDVNKAYRKSLRGEPEIIIALDDAGTAKNITREDVCNSAAKPILKNLLARLDKLPQA